MNYNDAHNAVSHIARLQEGMAYSYTYTGDNIANDVVKLLLWADVTLTHSGRPGHYGFLKVRHASTSRLTSDSHINIYITISQFKIVRGILSEADL